MMIQGSQEWILARVGKLTASRFGDVIGAKEARINYACEILQELATGEPAEADFKSAATDWGLANESIASSNYQFANDDLTIIECGFLLYDKYSFIGASPDRLVNFDGQIQIKCPFNTRNHVRAIHLGAYQKHKPQVQGELLVTGRDWSDLVSFDPRYKPKMLHVERIYRDESFLKSLEKTLVNYWQCIAETDFNSIIKGTYISIP